MKWPAFLCCCFQGPAPVPAQERLPLEIKVEAHAKAEANAEAIQHVPLLLPNANVTIPQPPPGPFILDDFNQRFEHQPGETVWRLNEMPNSTPCPHMKLNDPGIFKNKKGWHLSVQQNVQQRIV